MTRVLVVDDHLIIQHMIEALLAEENGYDFVGGVTGADKVLDVVEQTRPDIVVMNLAMPLPGSLAGTALDPDEYIGIPLTRAITTTHPGIRVLIFTALVDADLPRRARNAGAAGFLHKACTTEEFLHALRTLARGDDLWAEPTT